MLLKQRKQGIALTRLIAHGVPFTLTVQSRSAVRMQVATAQASRRPGGVARLTIALSQAGIPLPRSAAVTAEVRAPSGTVTSLLLAEVEGGRFETDIAMPTAGVYRVLARAKGATLRGLPFTREALRTLGVWTRGDDRGTPSTDPTPKDRLDLCGFLKCVIENGALTEAVQRAGIDLNIVRKCFDRHCPH